MAFMPLEATHVTKGPGPRGPLASVPSSQRALGSRQHDKTDGQQSQLQQQQQTRF